eukprot:TRINITY_DN793_c0_g1_i1.p1 TRINITY_DN793_c0_g1~~TRINITY_DN793_c0_g1_i1.p1  ORF type:complete len:686 (+),score=209.61 TRINITY_DN793_c0_g1_i1:39-2096(+)
MEELVKRYPDLSQSIVRTVFDQVNGDQAQAVNILKGISNNEPSEEEIERKLVELQNFVVLGKETMRKVLEECGWDVEKAIIPLFALLEEHQKQEKRKKYEEEKKIRNEEAKKKALHFLKDLFATVPEKQIRQMLESNDGNVELTTDQLMDMMQKDTQTAKLKKEQDQQKNERRQNREALAIRFNKPEKDVEELLNRLKWDVPAAIKLLLEEEQKQKLDRFTKVFSKMDMADLRKALEVNDYDEQKAIKHIQALEEERRQRELLEQQRRAEEVKRQLEKRREEEARINEIEKKKQQQMEQAQKLELEEKLAAERKRLEEVKRAYEKAQEDEKIRIEKNRVAEEKLKKEEEVKLQKQRDAILIEQSLLMAKQIKDEIQAEDIFNKVVGDHLRVVPGVDSDIDQNNKVENKEDGILLKPSKLMVDYGETITLTWSNAPQGTKNNWIGFYQEGSASKEYVSYTWTEGTSGTWEVKAPTYSGNYLFKFFVNKSYVHWASSEVVKVGPTFNMVPKVISNSEVQISVVQLSGQPCPNAWVGLYEPDKDHSSYYSYQYLSSSSELTFQIPKVGIWELRLFPQKAKNVATSCRVNLTGADSLQFSLLKSPTGPTVQISYNILTLDPYVDAAWIGIFTHTETDIKQYRRYRKIRNRAGEITMEAMKTPGVYEARLYASASEKIYCRSNTITIPPQ